MKTVSRFPIPPQYQQQLRYKPCTDTRSDNEIISTLQSHQPITSEKNIWAYWDRGVAKMPGWCQRNVASWVRMHDSSWTVRILDNRPDSPNYVLNVLPAELLPASFVNGTMTGIHVPQASSDLIRTLVLALYGGVYMDTGCILYMDLDWICWNQLADPETPWRAMVPYITGNTCGNAFIACRRGDPLFRRWSDLYVAVWKDRTSTEGILDDPLLVYEQDEATKKAYDAVVEAEFKVPREAVLEYLGQWLSWERLMAQKPSERDSFNALEYLSTSVLKLQATKEIWGIASHLPGAAGAEPLELLTTRLDSDPTSERYQSAEAFVFRLLTESSVEKIGRGTGLTKKPTLGALFDRECNENADAQEGTFAEILRYGAENFVQTREGPSLVELPRQGGGQ